MGIHVGPAPVIHRPTSSPYRLNSSEEGWTVVYTGPVSNWVWYNLTHSYLTQSLGGVKPVHGENTVAYLTAELKRTPWWQSWISITEDYCNRVAKETIPEWFYGP